MSKKLVSIEKMDRVAVVRFDRKNSSNALSIALMKELTEAAHSFDDDVETSAVILTGGPSVFSLGFDLKDPAVERSLSAGLAERRKAMQVGPRMCRAWEEIEPVTIVAVEGWCVGGGVALAISCDLRLAGRGSGFYVPEIERGLNMSWGSVPRIVNHCGPAKAKRIVIMAEKLDARRAQEWGMVDEVVPDGTVLEAALTMARSIAELPPVAVRMCKQDINAAANALNYSTSHSDLDQFVLAQSSEDFQEGVDSFFEKRQPKYSGR
ncbi:MAG: enoyl-CoA hydratase/isomerase family protein [Proteobacteria bacterium]|nr:enoyl-CoA hydratase/isomerase family protein [Pseudomonadota bacterium]